MEGHEKNVLNLSEVTKKVKSSIAFIFEVRLSKNKHGGRRSPEWLDLYLAPSLGYLLSKRNHSHINRLKDNMDK